MRPLLRLPDAVRNPLSLIGMVIATAMAVLFIVLVSLELLGYLENPYIGLLVFITVPIIFIVGLLLIPIGTRWAARRRRLHPEAGEWPVIDLREPKQRGIVVGIVALTLVNILIVSLAAYGGVHYMDSSQFCGEVCHETMKPEYVALEAWPHAEIECAQCHIGPGAKALVQAKLAGTRQLFHVLTGNVPKPVPPPEHLISPTAATCERCHWPEKFHGDKLREIREYANDEANSETITRLQVHVGGGNARLGAGAGIHWHMNLANRVEFVAGDSPDTVPYVRLMTRDGTTREYFGEGVTREQIANRPIERMECTDCHNRPAHTFFFTPERAVDTAMAEGRLPRELPFLRREAVAAVNASYPDEAAALAAIGRRLGDFYRERGAETGLVQRAVDATRDIYRHNVFPGMQVKWGTYPNQLGHVDSPGCFRCHDDSHKAADGAVIGQDCELCHTAPE